MGQFNTYSPKYCKENKCYNDDFEHDCGIISLTSALNYHSTVLPYVNDKG